MSKVCLINENGFEPCYINEEGDYLYTDDPVAGYEYLKKLGVDMNELNLSWNSQDYYHNKFNECRYILSGEDEEVLEDDLTDMIPNFFVTDDNSGDGTETYEEYFDKVPFEDVEFEIEDDEMRNVSSWKEMEAYTEKRREEDDDEYYAPYIVAIMKDKNCPLWRSVYFGT